MAPHRPRRDDVALLQQLRQLRSAAHRARTDTYYIEGVRMVAQAVQAGAPITLGVVAPELLTGPAAQAAAADLRATGAPVAELSADAFVRISFKESGHGIGAVMRSTIEPLAAVDALHGRWVALADIQNSGNLGAIMRTADGVGCAGLLLLDDTVDPYHPAALRASMGALFALRLVRTSFAELVSFLRSRSCPLIGTSPAAPLPYHALRYPSDYVLLMGSERTGLSVAQQAACEQLIHIPMAGISDSLNVAVATSIVLYAALQQRDAKP
jgi:RNA methyltransferase, TrmH family